MRNLMLSCFGYNNHKLKRRNHWLAPIGADHKRYTLAVCMCHCFRLLEESSSPPASSSSYYNKAARLAGRNRHQLRRGDFELILRREMAVAEVLRQEERMRKTRRSANHARRHHHNGADADLLRMRNRRHLDAGDAVVFKMFAPAVFRAMRAAMDIDQEDYIASLAPEREPWPYLNYVSGSKSKSSFMFTCDRRFVIKLEKASSIARLMNILEDYIGHFIASPHSLVVKILGAYSIKIGRKKTVYLLVTQSVFWPSSRIAARFDLKGCLAGRTEQVQNSNTNGYSISSNGRRNNGSSVEEDFVVLKDGNFVADGVHVDLGGSNRWFSEQLSRDVSFLRSVGAVDYSLLLGIQPLSTSAIRARQIRDEHEQDEISQLSLLTPDTLMDQAKYASAIKRSSLGFIGVSSSTDLQHHSNQLNPSPHNHQRRRHLNISTLADYMDIAGDGTILVDVNESGRLDERNDLDYELDSLSVLASEILDEEDDIPTRHSSLEGPFQGRSTLRRNKHNNNKNKVRVKQVKFHNSVANKGQGQGQRSSSPTPSLQFQLHPAPKDLPESPPIQQQQQAEKYNPNPTLSSNNGSLRLAQTRSTNSKLSLKTLLPNGGTTATKSQQPSPPSPLSSSPGFPLTPLIQEAEEEIVGVGSGRDNSYRIVQAPKRARASNRVHPTNNILPSDPDAIDPAPFNGHVYSSFNNDNHLDHAHFILGGPDNRRLLPDTPNGVHVIEGPHHRCYLGIVDILGEHDLLRRLIGLFKTMALRDADHSGVGPDLYAHRFHEFMLDNI